MATTRTIHIHSRPAATASGLRVGAGVVGVRGRGLWAGVDIEPTLGTGRAFSEALARRGVLVKDTHGSTIRLSPPLVITTAELDRVLDAFEKVLTEL
jgi:ornithine--oxo-acid transaminase